MLANSRSWLIARRTSRALDNEAAPLDAATFTEPERAAVQADDNWAAYDHEEQQDLQEYSRALTGVCSNSLLTHGALQLNPFLVPIVRNRLSAPQAGRDLRDRNMPRLACHNLGSIVGGMASQRFQHQKEFFG
ncbi:hypothetical protein GWG65_06565 [Bradyrhizobium sp. CSA207]|uniref:hypothetical protein n=1 Tax=Bradyrhizobium sp. CSA207 TaxID=2698826 RepID=UPI0023B131FB|nr:hypothetical protein [Bradyrhizobium sp. CSA207]MDE5441123.1 hypothetical protein [Bradyrhizobium sp. CSA207]